MVAVTGREGRASLESRNHQGSRVMSFCLDPAPHSQSHTTDSDLLAPRINQSLTIWYRREEVRPPFHLSFLLSVIPLWILRGIDGQVFVMVYAMYESMLHWTAICPRHHQEGSDARAPRGFLLRSGSLYRDLDHPWGLRPSEPGPSAA